MRLRGGFQIRPTQKVCKHGGEGRGPYFRVILAPELIPRHEDSITSFIVPVLKSGSFLPGDCCRRRSYWPPAHVLCVNGIAMGKAKMRVAVPAYERRLFWRGDTLCQASLVITPSI